MMTINTFGKVYLVGAGPGAADLITVRGAKILEGADIVFHDALVDQSMLDLCPQAIQVPVGKRCGKLSSAQHFINKRLIDAAAQYQTVVRLKGGDPMIFGRADEEIQALKDHHISVEVVPGITAALAGAASLQQSLTLRGISRSVAFVTLAQGKHDSSEDSNTTDLGLVANPTADTLVYYMGRKDARRIAIQLIESSSNHSDTTPVHILESVSTPKERHWSSNLGELANGGAEQWFDSSSPALILIGQALQENSTAIKSNRHLNSAGSKINDGLQNTFIFTDSRRSA